MYYFIYCYLLCVSIRKAISLYCNLIEIRFSVGSCMHEAFSKRTRGSKVLFFQPPPQTNIELIELIDLLPETNQMHG